MRLVYHTTKWQFVNEGVCVEYHENKKSFVSSFWHNRLMMMAYAWRSELPFNMLISAHRDGRIIADAVHYHGIKTIVGSKSKGGVQALRDIVKALNSGECVGLTPDGPRGPRLIASDGIASIAKLAKIDVVPASYAVKRRKVFQTWDRFILPLPFNSGVFIWGKPIRLNSEKPTSEDLDIFRQQVEDELNRISDEADKLCGHSPIPRVK